jgi:hypothetical protein
MAAEVWPLIRKQLPEATMRVYGAYPTVRLGRCKLKPVLKAPGFSGNNQNTRNCFRILL